MQMTHRVFAGWAGAADNDEVRDGAIACKPRKDLKEGFCGFAGHGDPVMFRCIAIKRLEGERAAQARHSP